VVIIIPLFSLRAGIDESGPNLSIFELKVTFYAKGHTGEVKCYEKECFFFGSIAF
jgi:hypothetical protein